MAAGRAIAGFIRAERILMEYYNAADKSLPAVIKKEKVSFEEILAGAESEVPLFSLELAILVSLATASIVGPLPAIGRPAQGGGAVGDPWIHCPFASWKKPVCA